MIDRDSENVVTKSIVVKQDVARAFRVWTERIDAWWPVGHSISGDPQTRVLIEGKVGGRFFERTSQGVEHDWGSVVVWEPPHRLVYNWYLGSGQEQPTRVEVQFVPLGESKTRVEIEHRGPELIGELWWLNNSRYGAAWDKVLPEFATVCEQV